MKLDRTNAELSDALTAAMDCIAGGLAALNASYQQANAEAAGHDKTADRLDKIVQAWRAQAARWCPLDLRQRGEHCDPQCPRHPRPASEKTDD